MTRFSSRTLICLAVTVVLAHTGRAFAQRPPRPDLVFLLIGEINMCGQADLDKERGDLEPIPGVLLLNGKGKWEQAQHPLNRYSTIRDDKVRQLVGPGAAFAARIRETYPGKTIGLIVNARINSDIDSWMAGRPLYQKTIERVVKVRGLKLAGIVWEHGESNRNDAQYLEKMIKFVNQWRKDLQEPKLPFVAGEIYGGLYPVNDYLKRLPKHVKWVDVASNRHLKTVDGTRFTRDSQDKLGTLLAEAWLGIAPQEFRPVSDDDQ